MENNEQKENLPRISVVDFPFKVEKNCVLTGRAVRVGASRLVIQDQSGALELIGESTCQVGDIVELSGFEEVENGVWGFKNIRVLVRCNDFFIQSSSQNYRRLWVDENLKKRLLLRAEILHEIRLFWRERGFLETETPVMVNLPGMEPYIEVFETRLFTDFYQEKNFERAMYLITSPEYAMKKLLAGGLEKIFQISKVFRNREVFSKTHNPEFTMLEWYRAYADYVDMMRDTEDLVQHLVRKFLPAKVEYLQPWKRITVADAMSLFADISEEELVDETRLRLKLLQKGYKVSEKDNYDDLFGLVMMREVEPELMKFPAVFLYKFPIQQASLSKKCADNPLFAERFETYLNGIELTNGFSELNDPKEQGLRLEAERRLRERLGMKKYDVDQSFLDALRFGMPPAGGNALGVDRLVMFLTETEKIQDVLFFPFEDL